MYCYNCMNEKGSASICPYCGLDNGSRPADHHLRPGSRLAGKYLVGYSLGEGGFGITYIGRDTTLDTRVAVKEFFPSGYSNRNSRISPEVTVSSQKQREVFDKGKERFLFEARSIAKFGSEPGIVNVRDYFEENGTAYIIMDYLDGMDLSRYLKAYGVMPAEQAFRIMLPVMRSLRRIHESGIIHRDISPDNIVYLKDGSLVLTDFGSARYFANIGTEMSVLLKQGYAPEEQYRRSGKQGPWTDVYGLCATIYRMITGAVPVDALDRMYEDTLAAPSRMGADISPALERVLMYGLAVNSADRCQDMEELIGLVNGALSGYSPPVNRPAAAASAPSQRPLNEVPPRTQRAQRSDREIASGRRDDARTVYRTSGYGDDYTSVGVEEEVPYRRRNDRDSDDRYRGDRSYREQNKPSATVPIIITTIAALIIGGVIIAVALGSKGTSTTTPTTATEAVTQPSSDGDTVELADVVGKSREEAESILKLLGFSVATEYEESEKEADTVIRTSPEAGTSVTKGSAVTIYVAKEKETEAPTEAQSDNEYVCIGAYGAYFYEQPSRTAQIYSETVPYSSKVTYLGESYGDFIKISYSYTEGWALKKFFARSGDSASPGVVNDREYNESMVCISDCELYTDTSYSSSVIIGAGETALKLGYCVANEWDYSDDYYEVYYNSSMYCLPASMLSNFE